MPQLLSRRDNYGWLTPSMADILTQGTAPLSGEENLRDQINQIQQRMDALDSPVRIVDVRHSPSRNLFIARPESRRGRKTSLAEIRRGLGKLDDEQDDWTLGFISQLPDDPDSVGILMRTSQHEPVRLRQLLLSNTFQHQSSTYTLALGVTVEQQIVVRNLEQIAPILAVGPQNSRRHLLRACLTTLMMLNTPTELRLALLGESAGIYGDLMSSPHALGRLISTVDKGQRLLEGMSKEVQRRHQWMIEAEVDSLDALNLRLRERDETPLPRILLLLSSLSDVEWQAAVEVPARAAVQHSGQRPARGHFPHACC